MKRGVAILALGGALVLAVVAFAGRATGPGHGVLFVSVRPHASESQVFVWKPGAGATPIGPATNWVDSAAWSPDGRSIAFDGQHGSWDEANPEDIYVMGADGQNVKQLTHSPGPMDWDVAPSWSPGGGSIVFVHGYYSKLSLIVNPSTGLERGLPARGGSPVWGKRGIAYRPRTSQGKVALLKPASGRSRVIVSIPAAESVVGLAWSRTGGLAVLEAVGAARRVAIYSVADRRTASFGVPTRDHRACALSWSPDGTRLVVAGYGAAWMVDATGKHWHRLPFHASGCSVSWR